MTELSSKNSNEIPRQLLSVTELKLYIHFIHKHPNQGFTHISFRTYTIFSLKSKEIQI